MAEKIIYRSSTESDIPGLMLLMNSNYVIKKPYSYFIWQYFAGFFPTLSYCAISQNLLIGMLNLQLKTLSDGTKTAQIIDIIVHPSWRNKGIISNLYEHAIKHIEIMGISVDLILIFANYNGYIASEKKFNLKLVYKINDLVFRTNNDYKLHSTNENNPSITNSAGFDYSEKYFKWRFDEHPYYQYFYVYLPDRLNFAVVKIFNDQAKNGKLGDIVYFPQFEIGDKHADALLLLCIELLNSQNVDYLTTWALTHTEYYYLLKNQGFYEIERDRYFCVKIINHDKKYFYNPESWFLNQCDSEMY